MRSPNCLTSLLDAFCFARLPSSTSAMPPIAASLMNELSDVFAELEVFAVCVFSLPEVAVVCASAGAAEIANVAIAMAKMLFIGWPPDSHRETVQSRYPRQGL